VVSGGHAHSFAELHEVSLRLSAALAARGVERGAVVGVALGDGVSHLASLYALLALGAVILPLMPGATPHELAGTLRFYGAKALVTPHAATLELGLPVLDLPALLAVSNAAAATEAGVANLDDPALITNSSGATGVPKGALWTQRLLAARFRMQGELLGLSAETRYGVVVPLFHSGSRNGALATLHHGGSVAFVPRHRPDELPELARRLSLGVLYLVPQSLELVARGPGERRLGGLSALYSTSDRLPRALRATLRRALTPRLYDAYVTSEAGYVSCFRPEHPHDRDDSVGRPLPGVEVQVVDERGETLPPGAAGELRTRGPTTPRGYHANETASALAFRDGWFYPGDRGWIDDAGFVELRGRSRYQFSRAGIKVFPEEIESVVTSHPDVREAAAVARGGDGEIVVFFTADSDVTNELVRFSAERLSSHKRPERFVRVDALPRNALGKVLRGELERDAEQRF
jgi:long-chain acyl-CoA synthetase